VLPFENLSDDKANAYLADGIQEEILTRPPVQSNSTGSEIASPGIENHDTESG